MKYLIGLFFVLLSMGCSEVELENSKDLIEASNSFCSLGYNFTYTRYNPSYPDYLAGKEIQVKLIHGAETKKELSIALDIAIHELNGDYSITPSKVGLRFTRSNSPYVIFICESEIPGSHCGGQTFEIDQDGNGATVNIHLDENLTEYSSEIVRGTIIHEILHTLGLQHTDDISYIPFDSGCAYGSPIMAACVCAKNGSMKSACYITSINSMEWELLEYLY